MLCHAGCWPNLGFCETAPTERDSSASAVPSLCLNCQCASPVSGRQNEGTGMGGRKKKGGCLTSAESPGSRCWRGWVTACLDSMQNVPRLYVGAGTVAATHAGIYRPCETPSCCCSSFMALLELLIWYIRITNTKQSHRLRSTALCVP